MSRPLAALTVPAALLLPAVGALVAVGCAKKPDTDVLPAPPAVSPDGGRTAELDPVDRAIVRFHMVGHAAHATAARDALIRGDLETARAEMWWLAENRGAPGTPEPWTPVFAALQVDAEDGGLASDEAELGAALGQLAVQCGACHVAEDAKLPWTAPPMPPAPTEARHDSTTLHMARHQWAVERLWASLVMPDPEAWSQGVDALQEPGLDTLDVDGGAEQADVVAQAAESIHGVDRQGLQLAPERRGAVFGEVVAACASCHTGLGEGP